MKAKQQRRLEKIQTGRTRGKWQDFAMCGKKGLTSATGSKYGISIFASPDGVDGPVAVGNICGISGRYMTPYMSQLRLLTVRATHKK